MRNPHDPAPCHRRLRMTEDDRTLIEQFEARHDRVSSIRQRAMANVTMVAIIALTVLLIAAVRAWHWNVEFDSAGLSLLVTLWVISLLCVIAASGLPAAIWRVIEEIRVEPDAGARRPGERRETWKRRKWFFYPGSYALILAVTVLIEQTGGLIRSPFNAVLYSLVLSGQQLGRFRLNSTIQVGIGAMLTVVLLAYERMFGLREVAEPPERLVFAILAISFATAAIFTHIEKKPNYKFTRAWPVGTWVEAYRDASGTWNFIVSGKGVKLGTPLGSGDWEHARSRISEALNSGAYRSAYGARVVEVEWQPAANDHEAFGVVRPIREVVRPRREEASVTDVREQR